MSQPIPHHDSHTRSKTDVFLDVDGVLNAVTLEPPAWGWPDFERVTVNGFPITYSPTMVKRLNALSDREHVTFFWLTTWLHEATDALCPALGLMGAAWHVLRDPRELPDNFGWWKLYALQNYVNQHPHHRILWIDDDIPYEPKALAWLDSLPHGQVEVVAPNTREGLTVDLMDYIERWVG